MSGWRLLEFYVDPQRHSASYSAENWTTLVHTAREAGLLATLLPKIDSIEFSCKSSVRSHALSSLRFAEKQYQTLIRELLELEAVFDGCDYPVLLVKGAAYRLSGYDYARYRLFSDIDLLVSKLHFPDAINRLIKHGFIEQTASEYEKNYYLNWSHQYPPLKHFMRSAEIDVHHTIFFAHSRVHINVDLFIERSTRIENSAFSLPTATDMFIHACLHLFYQEENQKLVKDLIDLHCLYQQIDDKTQILYSAEISNKKSAIAYGLMVQQWLFKLTLTLEEQSFIKQNARAVEIKWIQCLLETMLQDAVGPKWFADQLWFIRGHLIKMSFPTLIYHTMMKLVNSYKQKKRLGKEQKIIDAQSLPKDAR